MALTNFGTLTNGQIMAWSKDTWKIARNSSFLMAFAAKNENAVVQHVTELTKTKRGNQAVITLVPDLEGDGVTGDYTLKDNEEAIKAFDQVIEIDQLRNANRSAGRMAEQKQVVRFRETSRNVLGYWLGDRMDQLGFLTMSGVDYRIKTNGGLRPGFSHNGTVYARDTGVSPVGQALYDLAYSDRVTAPSSARHLRWDAGTAELVAGDVTAVVAADTPSYAMLVEAKAYAKTHYIKGVKGPGGKEFYHIFMTPKALAKLKLDSDFKNAVNNAALRGMDNPAFSGSIPTIDGLIIHEYRHVFNTLGATAGTVTNAGWPGYKWGADADVDGQRTLLCGAQALGMADIGDADWVEESEDYQNQPGVAVGKIGGFLKPQFYSPMDSADELPANFQDFSVLSIDCAI